MSLWDLFTKTPAELGLVEKFQNGFDYLTLVAFMISLFLWMISFPKAGKIAWAVFGIYLTVKVFGVIL